MEGVLYKRGDVVPSWRPRRFQLQPRPVPLLLYFKSDPGSPSGCLDLRGARISRSPGGDDARFTVESPDGATWHLQAPTQAVASAWLEALLPATQSGAGKGGAERRGAERRGEAGAAHVGIPSTPPAAVSGTGDDSGAPRYAAGLPPLGRGRPSVEALMVGLGAALPALSLAEQFERGSSFVQGPACALAGPALELLQAWRQLAAERGDGQATAAQAMFLVLLTQARPDWCAWSQHGVLYLSPEMACSMLRQTPAASTLLDLNECLVFSTPNWLRVFVGLQGPAFLLEALLLHLRLWTECDPFFTAAALESVAAALQALHSLVSSAPGMCACLDRPAFLPAVCASLDPGAPGTTQLSMQLLARACLFSGTGYRLTLRTLLRCFGTGAVGGPWAVWAPGEAEGSGGARRAQELVSGGKGGVSASAMPRAPAAGTAGPARTGVGAPPPAPPPPPPGGRQGRGTPRTPPPPPPLPPGAGQGRPPPWTPPPPPPPPPSAGGMPSKRPPQAPPPPPPPPPGVQRRASPTTLSKSAPKSSLLERPRLDNGTAVAEAVAIPTTPLAQTEGESPGGRQVLESSTGLEPGSQPASPTPAAAREPAPPPQPLSSQMAKALGTSLGAEPPAPSPRADPALTFLEGPHGRRPLLPLLMSIIQGQVAGGALDLDLTDQCLRLLVIVCTSPEGDAGDNPRLRRSFVKQLVELGLFKAMADLREFGNAFVTAELEILKASVLSILTPAGSDTREGEEEEGPRSPATQAPRVPAAPPQQAASATAKGAAARSSPLPPPPPRPGSGRKAPPGPPPPPPPPRRAGGGTGSTPKRPIPAKPAVVGASDVEAPRYPAVDPGPPPGRKLRAFFWDKIPEQRVEGTFWETHPPAYDSLDLLSLEQAFGAVQPRRASAPTPSPGSSPRTQALAVLDLKLATAIGIRMSRLRAPWRAVPAAAAAFDPRLLASGEDVDALLHCIPTPDQAAALESYVAAGGDAAALADAEALALALGRLPRLAPRLRALAAALGGPTVLADAGAALAAHAAAAAELRGSSTLHALLARVLALGNVLNHGGRLGAAPGFRLRGLAKLNDTRALDGKATLLSWLAGQGAAQEPCVGRSRGGGGDGLGGGGVGGDGVQRPGDGGGAAAGTGDRGMCAPPPATSPGGELQQRRAAPPTLLAARLPALASPRLRIPLADVAEQLGELDRQLAAARVEVERARCGVAAGNSGAHEGAVAPNPDAVFLQAVEARVTELSAATAAALAQLEAVRGVVAAAAAFFGENAAAVAASEQELWADLQAFISAYTAAEKACHARAAAASPSPRRGSGALGRSARRASGLDGGTGARDLSAALDAAAA